MATTNTDVSNAALGRLGAGRIADFDDEDDKDVKTINCRLYLEKTRDAYIRSHLWRFAKKRLVLQPTGDAVFEWDYQYQLPSDFLRPTGIYTGDDTRDGNTIKSYELEGTMLLINSSSINLKYIRQVTDPDEWDPLFYETFELVLARKLAIALSQDLELKKDIDKDLFALNRSVRAMDRNEGRKIGRDRLHTWLDARWSNIP